MVITGASSGIGRATALAWAKKWGSVVLADRSVEILFYSQAIPTTFILSPDGQIVAWQEGMPEYDSPEVREFLQSLVK